MINKLRFVVLFYQKTRKVLHLVKPVHLNELFLPTKGKRQPQRGGEKSELRITTTLLLLCSQM